MRKKLLLWLAIVSIALVGCISVGAKPIDPIDVKDIVVLYTNDVHCAIAPYEAGNILGYAAAAAMKKELIASGHDVILVDAGDAIQGEAIGTLSDGNYLVDIMNKTGYDLAVPGNHEFDYGMKKFLSLSEKAEYEYISCNFMDLTSDKSVFDAYVIRELGGKKIAFVGICTPRTITSSTPTYFQNENGKFVYGFQQDFDGTALYSCVQKAVDAARNDGAEFVIAVAHLGVDNNCSPWMSTEVIENTTGIDVMLDGHSHSTIECEQVNNKDGNSVLLTSTGTKFSAIGQLTIGPDGNITSRLITNYDKSDPEVESYIGDINAEFEGILNEVVAKTAVNLVINEPSTIYQEVKKRLIRNSETNMGDFCADAYRYVSGADIAIVNGGGIRADILEGNITYNDIIRVHPYSNELCMVEATGQKILDALELGAMMVPEESGAFLQVSGLTYEIHTDIKSSVQLDENGMFTEVKGEYRVKNVMIDGKLLDLQETYTVASHNYIMKNAGDGMNMFQDCKLVLEDIMIDNQVLITYITKGLQGIVGEKYANPYGEGRITMEQ